MTEREQSILVVSGLSGSGKSTALNALEDLGYYCIDNLPAALLDPLAAQFSNDAGLYSKVALGIDARAHGSGLDTLPSWIEEQKRSGVECGLLFLAAEQDTLIKRFSETRRRHPLTGSKVVLKDAISEEMALLEPLRRSADWTIDSTQTNIHQLRRQIWNCVGPDTQGMTIVLESFAFKKGVPRHADFVFDVRNLPNPYWHSELREFSGFDPSVAKWLEENQEVRSMRADILSFLESWLPGFEAAQRSYVTVGIGCTGGRHRSVYMAEQLGASLRATFPHVLVDHRETKR